MAKGKERGDSREEEAWENGDEGKKGASGM